MISAARAQSSRHYCISTLVFPERGGEYCMMDVTLVIVDTREALTVEFQSYRSQAVRELFDLNTVTPVVNIRIT
jgi:hypothetical protein